MNKKSQDFYEAKNGLSRLQDVKEGFVNKLYNGLVCGGQQDDLIPEFGLVSPTERIDKINLDAFIKNTIQGKVDFEKAINQKVYELAYLLDEREHELKLKFNKNV